MGGGCLQQELGVACGSTPHPPAPTGRHRGHRLPHRAQGAPTGSSAPLPGMEGGPKEGQTRLPGQQGSQRLYVQTGKTPPAKHPRGQTGPLCVSTSPHKGRRNTGVHVGQGGATGVHVVGTYNRHLSAPGDGPISRPGLLPEQARPPPDHTPLHGVASWPEADSRSICDSAQGEDSWERRVRANPGRQTPSASRPSR